jgi:regulatory protein
MGAIDDDRFRDPIEARKKAMDYLARREHGRGELLDKLTRFGFDPDIADAAVTRLVEDGLQSDSRFAEAFVRSRINQGKGPARIRADLRERGLAATAIDIALEEADEDWYALARDVRLKKFGPDTPSEFRDKAKQMRFLQSRGFEPDQIQAAVSADFE